MAPVTRAIAAVLLLTPYYFLRKATGQPVIADVVLLLAVGCWLLAVRRTGRRLAVPREPLLLVPPILAAIVWMGWRFPSGDTVRFHGLFAIDFGNLVAVVSSLRASPMLPLSYVSGGGPLNYHWLYFAVPATLADFLGMSMPNSVALWLTNVLVALLLVAVVVAISSRRAAAIVLFAPFTTYFYQAVAAQVPLGPLALPTRNHLLLSPVNSMLTFGNNTFALVLALYTLRQVERWNRDGRLRDAFFAAIALAMIPGYGITLVFPMALTLAIWLLMGRLRRPRVVIPLAMLVGAVAIAIFVAIGLFGSGGSRHIALGFDRGQFLRMVLFGLAPLWGLVVLGRRQTQLTIFHVLIASCIVVPSLLYVSGGPTGGTDFSMKTASLMAVAFAPLIAPASFAQRWRAIAAALLITLGAIQTAAYVLQFPYARMTSAPGRGVALPRDYVAALEWTRDHTPRSAVVIDPTAVPDANELFTIILAERRVWLPTAYTNEVLIVPPSPEVRDRARRWTASDLTVAREADIAITPQALPPSWQLVHRAGAWNVYRAR